MTLFQHSILTHGGFIAAWYLLTQMSDDGSERGTGEWSGGGPPSPSVVRDSTVTDSLDTTFELLSNARRRYLLYYLGTMDGPVAEVDTAVNAVSTYEAADPETDVQPIPEDIEIELQHLHLPKLADAGIVDYDPRHGTIRYTGTPALEEWVDHAQYKEVE